MKRLLLCLLCTCAVRLPVAAHVLDQYLQVAQIALAPDGVRIELRLVPGVQVAERVFAQIDVDGNKQISAAEEQAYAQRVLQDLSLSVNEQRTTLVLADAQFPTRAAMPAILNEGLGTLRLTFTATVALNGAGHQRLNFRNNHSPQISSYLVNALVPESDTIKITGQERDVLQRGLQVDFRVLSADARAWPRWTGVLLLGLCLALLFSQWKRLRRLCVAGKASSVGSGRFIARG